MYIKVCDRCGRVTKNKATFLLPTSKENGSYFIDNTWFGEPIILCNNCLKEFDDFRYNHNNFNKNLTEESKNV